MKVWHCNVCGKTTDETTAKDDAAPEHVSHRGMDIGSCPGVMEVVEDTGDEA